MRVSPDEQLDKQLQEEIEVARELLVQDVYRADRVFSEGDSWLDVGCHSGWFSFLAALHGTSVVGGVDIDDSALQRYVGVVPYGTTWHKMVSSGTELREVVLDAVKLGANALKLDIQGSERFLLNPGGWSFRDVVVEDRVIEKVLMEWHFPEKLPEIITAAEDHDFQIEFVERADDVMTLQETHIIYATRRK